MAKLKHSSVYARNLKSDPGQTPVKKGELLKIGQVKARLGCSKSHIYNLIAEGKIDCITLGDQKGKRVPEASLEKFIRSRQAEAGL